MKERAHLFCISVEVGSNISRMDDEDGKVKDKFLIIIRSCYKGGLIMNLEKPDEIRQSDGCGYTVYVEEMIPI